MMRCAPYLVGLGLLTISTAGAAEEPMPQSIIDCARIAEATERLECFDAVVAAAAAARAEAGEALVALSGTNDGDSEPFRANRPWYVEWNASGSIATFELHTIGGTFLAVVATEIGGGSGRSRRFAPGDYRIAVRGVGDWEVKALYE